MVVDWLFAPGDLVPRSSLMHYKVKFTVGTRVLCVPLFTLKFTGHRQLAFFS